jgi:hypothetical protein
MLLFIEVFGQFCPKKIGFLFLDTTCSILLMSATMDRIPFGEWPSDRLLTGFSRVANTEVIKSIDDSRLLWTTKCRESTEKYFPLNKTETHL